MANRMWVQSIGLGIILAMPDHQHRRFRDAHAPL